MPRNRPGLPALLRLAGSLASLGVTRYALQLARTAGASASRALNYPADSTIERLRTTLVHFRLRAN